MNLFFYENTPSPEAEQFIRLLRSRKSLQRLRRLPTDNHDMGDHGFQIHSGDLVVLFATTDAELTALQKKHEMFADFQVILILKDHSITNIITSHVLRPRFISFADSNTHNLEHVIQKINKNTTSNPYFLLS